MSNEEKILKRQKSNLLMLRNSIDNQLVEVDNELKKFASTTTGSRRNFRRERVAQFSDKGWRKPNAK
ncbi:MAG: hypothetical protein ACJ749_06840 [Flavisolibacter sp.]